MSDTPETDAVMKQHTEHSQNWLVIEMTNMSRKLERERDDLREKVWELTTLLQENGIIGYND